MFHATSGLLTALNFTQATHDLHKTPKLVLQKSSSQSVLNNVTGMHLPAIEIYDRCSKSEMKDRYESHASYRALTEHVEASSQSDPILLLGGFPSL